MSELLHASWALELELRKGDGTGRLVSGIVVPWDEPTAIHGGRALEVFKRGALTKSVTERGTKIPLHFTHDPLAIIGKAVEWRDDAKGQWAEFRISSTPKGDEALELIRDGVLHSFSVGFIPIAKRTQQRDSKDGVPIYERHEVKLGHVALLPNPAYASAEVSALREFDADDLESAPALAAARRRLKLL